VGDVIVSQTAHLDQPEHLRALSDPSRHTILRSPAIIAFSLVEPPLRHARDAASICLSDEPRELAA
jgi:hypothetical protein